MKLKTISQVRRDFYELGVKVGWLTAYRLSRYRKEDYRFILNLVEKFGYFRKLKVDPPKKISPNTITKISDEEVENHFSRGKYGDVLDLRGIEVYLSATRGERVKQEILRKGKTEGVGIGSAPDKVGLLLDAIAKEIAYFKKIASDPKATVDKVFHSLGHGKKNLGFLNVVIYRPLGGGKWVVDRERDWSNGESKYDALKGGAFPVTTLKSVIEGDKSIYDVDITDLSSFESEGLEYDIKSVENDLRNSKGPGRMLFVKLKVGEEVVGVVQIHNRVSLEEGIEPPPLLPDDPRGADRIKTALQLYFDEVSNTIATVKSRLEKRSGLSELGESRKAGAIEEFPQKLGYLQDGKLIPIKVRNPEGKKAVLFLEIIKEPYRFLRERSEEIVDDLFKVFAAAWEPVSGKKLDEAFYKDYIFNKYWKKAEALVVLHHPRGEILGFAAMTREVANNVLVFCLAGTVLHPSIQGSRLSVKLNKILVTEAWRENAYLSAGKINIVTRTANPRVVGALSILEDFSPDPFHPNNPPLPEAVKVTSELARSWMPGVEYDPQHQVLRGALTKGVGGLIYREDEMQLYRDERINEFCRSVLDYKAGDLFILFGKFSRKVLIKVGLKNLLRNLSEWWHKVILKEFLRRFY